MQIISDEKIALHLRELCPQYVAVAYLGKDWASYLAIDNLKAIVLSPTLGTNPFAVEALVDKIGWDKVHFLSRLHSKIYLGDSSVMLGSANLSDNALSGCKLYETVALSREPDVVAQAFNEIEKIINLAESEYPNVDLKLEQLKNLKELHQSCVILGESTSYPIAKINETFTIEITETYYTVGKFNIPAKYAKWFGEHGEAIYITLEGKGSLRSKVDRKSSNSVRIHGGKNLKLWFQSQPEYGFKIKIDVLKDNHINLSMAEENA
ncbi:hypothetical protein LZU85_19720 [Vibrio sp. IRLE0018]|uniref:hypothetical protein n=1 Tax=Vibrio TaxID=662 RepID=UPI001F361081|nr:hypothetical protein [Vibrio floridensis]MCF8781037.1 hypothetical protein [Vibrio floridensis]HDY8146179.1 phospholipase D family protein [Vibrio vulnificus]